MCARWHRGYAYLWDAIVQRYTEYVNVSERKGMLKYKTATDYRSRLAVFLSYIEQSKSPNPSGTG